MYFFRASSQKQDRTGVALVEFAISLPVFVLIVLGTVETCRMLYLQQSVKLAAYECARLGITPNATQESVQMQCDLFLQGRGLDNYTLTCEPPDPKELDYENLYTVSVSIPAAEATVLGSFFYRNKTITESVTIMAEY